MFKFIINRIISAIPVFLGVAIISFSLTFLSGDPVSLMVSMDTPKEEVENLREQLGYNLPFLVQFKNYMIDLLHLDFGDSLKYKKPVFDLVVERIPATLKLGIASVIIALLFGIPAGIISAIKKNGISDYIVSLFALFGQSVAPFWFGLMLILVFSVNLNWLPSSGMGGLNKIILPALTLGLFFTASVARLIRSEMLEILNSDFIRTANSKGLSRVYVIYKHALKNSLIPVVTMVGIQFGTMLGGAVVVETIFAWPGIGRLILQAIYNRDFPLVQGAMLFSAVGIIIANLIVDIIYRILDPRIKDS